MFSCLAAGVLWSMQPLVAQAIPSTGLLHWSAILAILANGIKVAGVHLDEAWL